MLAWPKCSWTYFGCLPAMRSIVAQVCLRSWTLMGGSSALFKRGLKWRPRRLVPLLVVPVRVGKTRSLSCQRGPAARLSWFWRERWRPRACVAFWEHFMERPLPFLGFSKMWPVLVWLRVRFTWSVAVGPLGSMSSHFRPRSSPSLRPQWRART